MHEGASQRGSPRVQRSPISDLTGLLLSTSVLQVVRWNFSLTVVSALLLCSLCFIVRCLATATSSFGRSSIRVRRRAGICSAGFKRAFASHCALPSANSWS